MKLNSIKIMDKRDCERAVREQLIGAPYAIVSINDIGSVNGKPTNMADVVDRSDPNQIVVLQTCFEDIDTVGENGAMTLSQACDIYQFVEQVKDDVDVLIIHCLSGRSRSAGVAAALGHLYPQIDMAEVFGGPKFDPNMFCLRLVLEAAEVEYDESFWDSRRDALYRLWETQMCEDREMTYQQFGCKTEQNKNVENDVG